MFVSLNPSAVFVHLPHRLSLTPKSVQDLSSGKQALIGHGPCALAEPNSHLSDPKTASVSLSPRQELPALNLPQSCPGCRMAALEQHDFSLYVPVRQLPYQCACRCVCVCVCVCACVCVRARAREYTYTYTYYIILQYHLTIYIYIYKLYHLTISPYYIHNIFT